MAELDAKTRMCGEKQTQQETAEETREGKNPSTTGEKKIEDLKRPCKLKSCLL